MKALVNTTPGRIELQELPCPEPAAGQVLIRTAACAICATDLEMIAGWDRTACPAIPGHEWSGRIHAVGPEVADTLIGTPCVAENVLLDGGEIGFEHPGGYGEYFVTEAANVQPLPDEYPLRWAALIEPLGVCVRGLRRLRLEDRSSALVLGDGTIGLLMTMLLLRAGVEHIAVVGGRRARLDLAREVGASAVMDFHEAGNSGAAGIREGLGTDFAQIIEASGAPAAVDWTPKLVQPGGKILVVGDYGDAQAAFRWNTLLHKEIELIGTNASAGAWPEAVRLAVQERLPIQRLISHCFPVPLFERALETGRREEADAVKVILDWECEPS